MEVCAISECVWDRCVALLEGKDWSEWVVYTIIRDISVNGKFVSIYENIILLE